MKKKTPKKIRKVSPLERIALSLEDIASSLKSNKLLNELVDKQIELQELDKNFWTLTDFANEPTSKILEKAHSLFNVYVWDENNLDTQFPAPEKDITFSVRKSIDPDQEHRNKSYNEFIKEDKKFINFRQYLLLCIFVWETEKQHLDIIGWTRTSSLWSDGNLVYGCWDESDSKLCMGYGYRACRSANYGPRELFLSL